MDGSGRRSFYGKIYVDIYIYIYIYLSLYHGPLEIKCSSIFFQAEIIFICFRVTCWKERKKNMQRNKGVKDIFYIYIYYIHLDLRI